MQTYWINPGPGGSKRTNTLVTRSSGDAEVDTKSEISSGDNHSHDDARFAKDMRLIEWTVDLLFAQLQKIVATRSAHGTWPRAQRINSIGSMGRAERRSSRNQAVSLLEEELAASKGGGGILEEFSEVIEMPRFDTKTARKLSLNDDMHIEMVVKEQLKEYVTRIASMYRDVPFHNFEVSAMECGCSWRYLESRWRFLMCVVALARLVSPLCLSLKCSTLLTLQ